MPEVELEFFGAARTVTGSMHLLHIDGKTVSMDCGLFQGRRNDAAEKNRKFPMRSSEIDAVLLSHAHIDHSGKIPALVKHGFTGPIYATPATADLCEIMLADSAHIQQEDARFWNERRARSPKEHIQPLYGPDDALQACRQFEPIPYNQPFRFAEDSFATFLEAGHILGSACVFVEIEGSSPVRLLYTGDLGRFDVPILRDPDCPFPEVDYLITETTYANRRHHNPTRMKEQLVGIIKQTRAAGGKVIIPSFSVGRTQTVAYYLTRALHEGLLEPLPIYVDSPLSVNATEIFKKHPECYDEAASDFWQARGDIFGKPMITYITDVNDSKALNHRDEPCVIIASSGMCEAGRIKHHLKNNVEDEANTVVIVGFMAQNTLGRRIVERREELKIYGRMYRLLCRVEILNGFSAHADRDELTRALAPLAPKLKGAFCVHGEGPQPEAMKQIFHDSGCSEVHIPAPGDKFPLT